MQLQYVHRFSFYKLPLGINGNVHNRSCLHNCLRSRHQLPQLHPPSPVIILIIS